MARLKVEATPKVLEWARLSAGLSPEAAARKVSAKTAAEQLLAWEAGDDHPTIAQLRKLAIAYRRPLSLFFLPEPPLDFQPMHDFRRLPGEVAHVYGPALRREMRRAFQRRELALELVEDLEEKPRPFEPVAMLDDDPEEIAKGIRDALSVTYADQTSAPNRNNSFGYWRRRIESLSVLVFQADRVELSEMLGFSIAMDTFPVIMVNRKNKRGRVFTLLHEFTHLMLRRSGICDLAEENQRPPDEERVEVFCNAVAGAALLPAQSFLVEPIVVAKGTGRSDWSIEELNALADKAGVSALVVMRRLLTLGRTTHAFYANKQAAYQAIYAAQDASAKEELGDEGIPRNMPVETISMLGAQFVRLVLDNYHGSHITLSDVSDYLGVKVRHVPKIEEQVRAD